MTATFEGKSDEKEGHDSIYESQEDGSVTHDATSDGAAEEDIATKEERWVILSRWLVFVVMASAATLVGIETFQISSRQQEEDFQNDYYITAEEILEESEIRAGSVFGTIRAMSKMATTLSLAIPGAGWPFVTLPHFEEWAGGKSLELAGILSLSYGVLVPEEQVMAWNEYSMNQTNSFVESMTHSTTPFIWRGEEVDESSKKKIAAMEAMVGASEFAVLWQMIPRDPFSINHDEYESSHFAELMTEVKNHHEPVLSKILEAPGRGYSSFFLQPIFQQFHEDDHDHDHEEVESEDGQEEEEEEKVIVGYLKAQLPWDHYFQDLLPDGAKGIQIVVSTDCLGDMPAITYELEDQKVNLLGLGDLHDTTYEHMAVTERFDPLAILSGNGDESEDDESSEEEEEDSDEETTSTHGCGYAIHVYPSPVFHNQYKSNRPALYTAIGVIVILCTALVFMVYDWFVQRRQRKMQTTANRTNAIVNSLFPSTVRDRLFDKDEFDKCLEKNKTEGPSKKFGAAAVRASKPIADLFTAATVMFADFNGFTAWSSVREPSQVFTLLEAVYDSFDTIAKRRGVFKVETIGDCYVAACGLPVPRSDHAVVMARFATECLGQMVLILQSLEVLLGPDTGDLGMRFGLHSGPVMAGVLRGEKSRFQLFGDTVNTTARIESTGAKNRIHLSKETADLLIQAEKSHWVKPRSDMVTAKGKGKLQTYWLLANSSRLSTADHSKQQQPTLKRAASDAKLQIEADNTSNTSNSNIRDGCTTEDEANEKQREANRTERLVDFNTEVLAGLLRKMVAMRKPVKRRNSKDSYPDELEIQQDPNKTVLDEVKEIISLPSEASKFKQDPATVQLPSEVVSQLRTYVQSIASMYRSNHFHSFDHASHVTMSVTKLLSRVVDYTAIDYTEMSYKKTSGMEEQHQFTYGITSDPLTQFAVGFSALIHDVDHPGLPNAVLVKEGTRLAQMYRNQSVAEQNSVDLAWNLLMGPEYDELRQCIYTSQEELNRFRQLVVNSVMATDIVDKELGALRKARWAKAFDTTQSESFGETDIDVNRKATIVIEHLIQASDVAHTMQHWHVYLKWNKRLFMEVYAAYKSGHTDTDPSISWYKGELGFFDFYLIPLANKLRECGVFGVSSDEFLDYATANRREWELKGEGIVKGYLAEVTGQVVRTGATRRPSMCSTTSMSDASSA